LQGRALAVDALEDKRRNNHQPLKGGNHDWKRMGQKGEKMPKIFLLLPSCPPYRPLGADRCVKSDFF
jgi:hypothetical protein